MLALFRLDVSARLGTGHLMRCLSLADEWKKRGGSCFFVVGGGEPAAAALVERVGHRFAAFTGPADDVEAALAAAADEGRPEWIVVDHYGLDAAWERGARKIGCRVLAIDDLADRPHDADVLLDQNLARDMERRYRDLVSPETIRLFGPSYALLRPEFRAAHDRAAVRPSVRRICVSFGGSDPTGETLKTLDALRILPDSVRVDVVAGALTPRLDLIEARCRERTETFFHRQPPDYLELLVQADLAVGGAGTSAWERCCVGLPALTIAVAENQRGVADGLDASGAARHLGWCADVAPADIAAAVADLMASPAALSAMSRKAAGLADGRGAERVVDALLARRASVNL